MKKRIFTSVLSLFLVMATLFGFAGVVSAASDNQFYVEGAQIRTTGKQGIRFVAYLEKGLYDLTYGENANFGILIARKDRLSEGEEITIANASPVPANNLLENTDTYCKFTAVITDQPAEAYGIELVARAYVAVNGVLYYSNQISRSIKQVAEMIVADPNPADTDLAVANEVLARYQEVGNDITVDAENLWNRLITYPEYPEQINRDYTYSVSVEQGTRQEDLVVYNQTEAFFYQNRFNGGDTNRRFCEFAFSGDTVTVNIKVNRDFTSYTVAPTSKGYASTYANGVISVTVSEPTQFVLMLDDDVNTALSVFADAPETDVPVKGADNVIYVEGWNNVTIGKDTDANVTDGVLTINGNRSKLYIAPGAVLVARVVTPYADKSDKGYGIKIYGRGAILDPASMVYHTAEHGFDNSANYDKTDKSGYSDDDTVPTDYESQHLVKIGGYSSTIQDVKLLDSRRFNLNINRGSCTVDNVKILSTMMTSDGITTVADSGTVKNCFVYCGDNALVAQVGSGSKGYSFENITVGTTCSAIYPQNYCDSTFTDIYVFRADEGLIAMKHGDDAKTVVINNLDALDCVRTPWLFNGENVGSGAKSITLNKVLMRRTTGSSNWSDNPSFSTTMYKFGSSAGSNYTFNITDLYVGGTLITSDSQVSSSNTFFGPSNFKKSYASSGSTPAKLAGHKETVNYTCDNKVIIGVNQVFLKNAPIAANGTWYLPYEEIKSYLAIAPSNPALNQTVGGLKVISLANLIASGAVTAASYDSTAKAIKLTAAITSSTNLLKENYNTGSNFNPLYYKDKTAWLDAEKNGNVWEYTALSNDSSGGIVRMILDEYQRYGAGTYTISFEYKATGSGSVGIGVDHTESKYSVGSLSSSSSWTTFSKTVTLSVDPASVDQMALWFSVSSGKTISIRNVTLTKAS